MLVCGSCQTEATEVLDDTLKYDAHGVKTNSIVAIKFNPACWGIGRFSRAIYRLGY